MKCHCPLSNTTACKTCMNNLICGSAEVHDAKERVRIERDELRDRHYRLLLFMRSEKFDVLSETQKDLLVEQSSIMYDYIAILNNRLSNWENV